MAIIGVNGIATHGEGNTDVLLRELEARGHETVDVWLPKRHTITAWWKGKEDAKLIEEVAKPGDTIIAHSFGCLRTAYALRNLKGIKTVYMFRPAMSKKWKFDLSETKIFCIYSDDDHAILLGGWIPFHPFGHAGREGFTQKGVVNLESAGDHNADFATKLLRRYWAEKIEEEL